MQEVTIYVDGPDQLKAVYALLAGVAGGERIIGKSPALGAPYGGAPLDTSENSASQPVGNAAGSSTAENPAASPSNAGEAPAADGERDAAGVVWDANKHASTKTKTSAGLWRMKVGVKRPEGEELPQSAGNSASSASPPASDAPSTPSADEDDEFAAFRAAAGTSTPTPTAARNWTDADLSKLCNQGAIAAGDPEKVKAIIAKYIPEGQPSHSRHIPADQRETFASDLEKTLGIQYAG